MLLNIYDLSPANDYLFPVGLGLHHSGVEIDRREYSFGSGGSGIFEGAPKEVPNARFRCQVDMGSFDGGSKELNQALDELRSSGFGPNDYNLVRRNCNHFCQALCMKLLQKPIPGHVNRIAAIGDCCSCLLPRNMLQDSPVGGSSPGGTNGSSSSFLVPTKASMSRSSASSNKNSAFSGTGHSLGSSSAASTESGGLLSKWTQSSHQAQGKDDLTDRREKARLAALARLERNQKQASNKESQD